MEEHSQDVDCNGEGNFNQYFFVNHGSLVWDESAPSKQTHQHGTVAVYECYDDFDAAKKDDFRQLLKNANLELGCAAGTKLVTDECRNDQTNVLWDTNRPLAYNNDKLVSVCVNG